MPDNPGPVEYTLLGGMVATFAALLGKVFFAVFTKSDEREVRLANERTQAEKAGHDTAIKSVEAVINNTNSNNQLRETLCELVDVVRENNNLLKGLPCREFMATARDATPRIA